MGWHNDISELEGQTLVSVEEYDDEIYFKTDDGKEYKMYHSQDCCESVYIEDIIGDLQDLIGSPIIRAEERTDSEEPYPSGREWAPESYTWTFYEIATNKGSVTIRWFGESNGYYSETADFRRINKDH